MAAIDDLIKQIQSQGTTSKWTGGYGADAATKDMARILNSIGITDIKQFGKVPQYAPAREAYKTYNGRVVQETFDEETGVSRRYTVEPDGVDEEGYPTTRIVDVPKDAKLQSIYAVDVGPDETKEVDESKVRTVNGQVVADTGQTTFGNKLTGQAVPNTYSERQSGNAFGGTFEGKGNTGYRVDFTPEGTPVFYTTGASSNDLFNILQDNKLLNIAANVAAASFGPAGAAALQLAQGKDIKDAAKAAALAYAGQQITSGFGGDASSLAPPTDAGGLLDLGASQGMTAAELAQLNMSLGGVGGSAGATELANALATGAPTSTITALTGGSGVTPIASPTAGYYDEITGKFISDPLGGLPEPLTNATSGTNINSMAGYDYDPVTGNWTLPTGEVISTTVNPNPVTNGGDIMRNAGVMPPVVPPAAKSPLGVSDALRAAGLVGALTGGAKALSGGSSGFPIVPIPSDWTSPIKPTGVAEFKPLTPIDFGNKEMLRGTQWEQLLSPDYGKAPAMPTSTNPSNMTFNELTRILGGSRESIPTQNLSINDVIAGIQSQYGQTPQGSVG